MANGLYAAAKKKFLDQDAGMDLLADTIKVTLIDVADYTVNLSTHDFYDDAVAGQVSVATLGTKTTSGGDGFDGRPTAAITRRRSSGATLPAATSTRR